MRRALVILAIESGIPVDVWLAGDPLDLTTAIDVLVERSHGGG